MGSSRRWTLRRQLAVILVVMTVAAVVVIGTISVVTQRSTLIDRVDEQLLISLDAASRDAVPNQMGPPDDNTSEDAVDPDWQDGPDIGPQLGGLTVVVGPDGSTESDQMQAQYVDTETGEEQSLDEDQIQQLVSEAGTPDSPSTVELHEAGRFRTAAREVDDETTVIAGQSLTDTDQTVQDQVVVFALVAAATLSVTLAIALYLVRRGLIPLQRLSKVAGEVSATPLASGDVALQRVPEAATDPVTEAGQVGEAFNTMLAHVEAALQERESSEQRLRQFIADASHELRTPLAAVAGYAELAQRTTAATAPDADAAEQSIGTAVHDSLSRIRAASSRMSLMVESLLLLARLDSGVPVRHEPVPLAGLVMEACSDAQVTSNTHQWVMELPENAAEITVSGDPDRLYQVMNNLLTNARTHTPAGTTVTVSVESDAKWARITVHDDGPGIDDEHLEKIFDRFYRGDASRTQATGSSGLGLSIVQAIVTAHRGSISVSSTAGSTSFSVLLPLLGS